MLLIILLFLLVFGILGVQIFKGAISYCNDESPSITKKTDCVGTYTVTTYDANQQPITTTVDRKWITPFNNYNNVLLSMLNFFEICSLEMWPMEMFRAMDAVGVDMVPIRNHNMYMAILFVIFIFLTTFFIMNLFISVIVDKFNDEIKKRQGAFNFSDEQKEWVKIQRLLVHTNPKIIPTEPQHRFRKWCYSIVQSQSFEYFIMMAIVINTVVLCIDYHGKSEQLGNILDIANYLFVFIFTTEMILKLLGYGFTYYFHVNWNKFDFIIVIMSLIAINENII